MELEPFRASGESFLARGAPCSRSGPFSSRWGHYFFDTYALIETAKGKNESYKKYLKSLAITTKLNLLELYFVFIREGQKDIAKTLFRDFSKICVPTSDEILMKAAEMRLDFLKLDLSYVDCIGYIISQQLGIKFLTGDSKFKNFENVEFVK